MWTKFDPVAITKQIKKSDNEFSRRTKIVATIGPKTQTVEALEQLIDAGVNVIRMNFSHGDYEFHQRTVVNAKTAANSRKRIIALMLDTKGPEIRTGTLEGGKDIELQKGQELILTTEKCVGNSQKIYVDYINMPNVVQVGTRVLIDDGLVGCVIKSIEGSEMKTVVENTGLLGEKKGVNLPGIKVDLPALTPKDVEDLQFGVKMGVDFIAASFVRRAQDVKDIRQALGPKGQNIKIISKIENIEGLENFDQILELSDGIMVARGDLGVEIPIEQVSLAQKMMIAKCNVAGKPVITATQMLESMIVNPRPTRAEATDVANAVFDGTDAVMLSGETAKGKFPIETVRVMARICETAETALDYHSTYATIRDAVFLKKGNMDVSETIASSAAKTAADVKASIILALTESGQTARLVTKYRPGPIIIAITQNKETARQLMVSRGVFPQVVGSVIGTDRIIQRVIEQQKESGVIKAGEYVIVTSGHVEGIAGQTNIMRVITA